MLKDVGMTVPKMSEHAVLLLPYPVQSGVQGTADIVKWMRCMGVSHCTP